LGICIALIDVRRDRGDGVFNARDGEAAQLSLGESTEEAFDQIEPRRRGRNKEWKCTRGWRASQRSTAACLCVR
jgi:hypothetical protein